MKPGEKKAGTQKPSETTGQAPRASDSNQPSVDKGAAGKMEKEPAAKGAPAKSGGADMKKGKANESTTQAPSTAGPKSSQSTTEKSGTAAPKASQSTTTEKGATTGQGAASGSAKLSTEQRTKITTIIKQQKVQRLEPSKLNISISVGARVPSTLRFYPLPVEVIAIYPEWLGYDYILVGDEILVIDRRTHQIVAILEA